MMTFSIKTFSIKTFSLIYLIVTFSISIKRRYDDIFKLGVAFTYYYVGIYMVSVIMLNAVMPSVVAPS